MNIREAILKAADHIERNPGTFRFSVGTKPHDCGSPGCAIGWIGYFAGCKSRSYIDISKELFNIHHSEVYLRLTSAESPLATDWAYGTWPRSAERCACALRFYADKYHPADGIAEVTGLPASVRAIFDMTPAELGRELSRI